MERIILMDVSGSMAEDGKESVLRYLVYAIRGIVDDLYPDIPYRFFCWSDCVTPYEDKISVGGKTDASAVSEFLDEHAGDCVLLIGDGNYSEDIRRALKKANCKMLVLMIGSDCNRDRLKRLADFDDLYETTDVSTCLDKFMSIK